MKIIRGKDIKFVPVSHEDPKDPGALKKVLLKKEEIPAGRIQMINWAKIPVGKHFRPHYQEDLDEIFIIISGKASIRIDDEHDQLGQGDGVVISKGSVHEMANIGTGPLIYLVIGISRGSDGKTVVVDQGT